MALGGEGRDVRASPHCFSHSPSSRSIPGVD